METGTLTRTNADGSLKPLVKKCGCGAEVEVPNVYTLAICPTCLEVRGRLEAIEAKRKDDTEREWAQKRINEALNNVIPARYKDIESDRRDIVDVATKDDSFFFYGTPGTGKTVLAASLARKIIMSGLTARWESYPAMIMKMQCMYRSDKESPFAYAEQVSRFNGLLVLDDLGAEKLTDFVRQTTYYILNEREQRMLPVVITSNHSLAEIDKLIDSRVSSRIAGMCKVVKLSGNDRRIKGAI